MKNQTFGIEIETTGLGRERTARALGDERTADYTDGVADDLVALAESAGHVIRR